MNTRSTTYYRDSLKESVMLNYSRSKTISLASSLESFESEIKNSTLLQPTEKRIHLQNLQKAYEQTRDEIFGKLKD